MKIGPVLLILLLLAAAAWLLFGDDSEDLGGGLGGNDYLDGAADPGPGLETSGQAPEDPLSTAASSDRPTAGATADERKPFDLVGRVVDERRLPVADVSVELRAGTRVLARGTSDAEGRYAFSVPASARGGGARVALVARASDGRVGMVSVWLGTYGGGEQTLPVVVLAVAHELRVQVVREGGGVLGAQVSAVLRSAGVPLLLATEDGDEDGVVTLRGLPAGSLECFATAPGHGRGRSMLRVPREPEAGPALIELQGERVLSVRVVDARTRRPVQGAEILVGDARTMPVPHGPGYLPPLPPARTDARGYTVIRRLGAAETIYVNARAPGYAFTPWWHAKNQVAAPGQGEVEVALARRRRVRCPVVEVDVPTPPDGTPLEVFSRSAERATGGSGFTAIIENGDVIIEGLGAGGAMGVVVAPGGAQGPFTVRPGAAEGSTITFGVPQSVRVRVLERGGAPVSDLPLVLNPGGQSPPIPPAVTDADGLAVFAGVGTKRATLHRAGPGRPFAGGALATLDLTAGIDVHEVVLEPSLEVVLTLRIDGEARLPPEYGVMANGQRLDAGQIEEDALAGELRLTLRPPEGDPRVVIEVHPRGFLTARVEVDPRDGRAREALDLRTAGTLVVRVTPPEDAQYALQLQRFDATRETWAPARIPTPGAGLGVRPAVPDDAGAHVYEGLAPGRYRVFDRSSRQGSAEVEVQIGGRAELDFDLSGAQWIAGRVVGPPGANLVQARVRVEGRAPRGGLWSGVRPNAEGVFRVRADSSRPLTLKVTHPTLMPAAEGGRVTVRPGASAVELRLEPGPELRFRVAGYEDAQTPPSGLWSAPLTVHLMPAGGGETLSVRPVADGGTFRAGGYRPGTYTLWLTFGRGHAPYVRERLELGRTSVDLGTVTPPKGSTLRVRIAGLAERPSAAVWATATHEGEPAYTRHARLDREAGELISGGLGAGRFRVLVRGAGLAAGSSAARVLLDRVVTSDGTGDVVVDVRLP